MTLSVIKVDLPYTEYFRRGLRFPAATVDEAAGHPVEHGSVVTVFDCDLTFTRHEVVERGEFVTLGPATPWPGRSRENRGWRG